MHHDEEFVEMSSQRWERVHTQKDEWYQSSNACVRQYNVRVRFGKSRLTGTVDIETLVEEGLENGLPTTVPDWLDVERNGVDQA